MKSYITVIIIYFLLLLASASFGQTEKVVITGVRFAYPMVEQWIKEYQAINPGAQLLIEPRSTSDPANYDLLIEAYEPDQRTRASREYLYLARYALLPVANANSEFAKIYGDKGLTTDQLKSLFFHDILVEKKKSSQIAAPVTVYTRLQKAGAPITFAHYFGYQQDDINGKAISGSDEHLIKAVLKDSTGVSYASINLVYDLQKRTPLPGLKIIPVDLDGNGRVSETEKIPDDPEAFIQQLEGGGVKNVPLEYLHLSIRKDNAKPEALRFLLWVLRHGQDDLHQFGFLKPEAGRFQKGQTRFEELTAN